MNSPDLGQNLAITYGTCRFGSLGTQVSSDCGRSDLGGLTAQDRADRIDSVLVAVSSDELHDQRCGRSMSAAKKGEAGLTQVRNASGCTPS